MRDDHTTGCCFCRHDVDNHDERARCLSTTCSCGWNRTVVDLSW